MQIEEVRIDEIENQNTHLNVLKIENKAISEGGNTIMLYHQHICNNMLTKICSKCGKEKYIDDFHRDSSKQDGHKNKCKSCVSEYFQEHKSDFRLRGRAEYQRNTEKYAEMRKANAEKMSEYQKKYRQQNRDKISERSKKYYEENKENLKPARIKYAELNKEKMQKYYLEYQIINKERETARKRDYKKTPAGKLSCSKYYHTRKTRRHAVPNTLTLKQWNKILENQNKRCAICGKRFSVNNLPTKDHIIPLSNGGGFTFENVQALCNSCNSSKNNRVDLTNIVSWGVYGS
jgi:5-methylcytosine-specific restriction endonuclease McrA